MAKKKVKTLDAAVKGLACARAHARQCLAVMSRHRVKPAHLPGVESVALGFLARGKRKKKAAKKKAAKKTAKRRR